MNKLMILVLVLLVSFTTIAPLYDVIEDIERSYTPMQLGEIWAKLGKGEALSLGETEFLRIQGNLVQNTTAITSWWIGADQQPHVGTIYADRAVLRYSADNYSFFGYDPLDDTPDTMACTSGDFTAITIFDQYRWDAFSLVIPYDLATGKFRINPIYANNPDIVMSVLGSLQSNNAREYQVWIRWLYKSDDTEYDLFWAGNNTTNTSGGKSITFFVSERLNTFTENLSDLYFTVSVYAFGEGLTVTTPSITFHAIR